MPETSTNPVDQHLRDDETVIWKGRPEGAGSAAGVEVKNSGGLVRRIVIFVVFIAAGLFIVSQNTGQSLKELLPADLSNLPVIPIAALVVIVFVLPVVFKALKIDSASRVKKYLGTMGFAITDRRIVIADRYGAESLGPGEIGDIEIHERENGLADVRLGKRASKSSGSSEQNRDPVQAERRWIGFKRVRDAGELRQRLESWRAERVEKAEKQCAAFVRGDASAMKAIGNTRLGVECIAPAHWSFEARDKKQPFGTTFLDKENWRPLDSSGDWNVVRMSGPLNESVLLEVFETEPKATLDSMTGKMANLVLGKPTRVDESVEIGRWKGFSVTREPRFPAGMPRVSRDYVLHDGSHQLYASTSWPRGSAQTERAIDTVLRSVERR